MRASASWRSRRQLPLSLTVGFAGTNISIRTDQPFVHKTLREVFSHCLWSGSETPKAVYSIFDKTLHFNGDALSQESECDALLTVLMQHLVEQLITDNSTHLILHGTGLVAQQRGILACASSGRGKSTLATWLILSGADYLSDELIAIAGNQMTGFARPLVLKPGSSLVWQKWLSRDEGQRLLHLPCGFTWLHPKDLRPDCVREQANVDLILFPRYQAQARLSANSLTPAETAFHLMQYVANARNLPGYGLPAATRLARSTRGFALVYGDVAQVEQWIKEQAP